MTSQQIFLFRAQIENRRFDDGTIRILEAALASIDVRSLMRIRHALKEFMRSESLRIVREISAKSAVEKLLIVEFLVHVFALIDDVESCLALRYEALVMREKEATSDNGLEVSNCEWLSFAEHSFDNGYYNIARKACEKAQLSFKMSNIADPEIIGSLQNVDVSEKIKGLKDAATVSASSRSVQAQAAEYLKRRKVETITLQPSIQVNSQCPGSILFMNGIKRWNIRKFHEHQRLGEITCRNMENDMEVLVSESRLKGVLSHCLMSLDGRPTGGCRWC